MQTIDTCPTVRNLRSKPSTNGGASDATACTRRRLRIPLRPSTGGFTAGQLEREDYARAVIEARTSGMWL